MHKLPHPKPFHHPRREGQFVEALRRPPEPDWNLAHETMRVEEQLPEFALNGECWQTRVKGSTVFYYEVPFVLPIRGVGN